MRVWLRLIGEFSVYRDGALLPPEKVGSRKARTLLALLAAERGRLVPVDRVIDVLWRNAPRHPVENVATMVSRLRAAVGPEVIAGGRTGYRLGRMPQVDLNVAAGLVNTAEAHTAGHRPLHALDAAQQALSLLGGGGNMGGDIAPGDDIVLADRLTPGDDVVLADHPAAAWAEPARALHAGLLRRARHVAATEALHTGWAAVAETVARAAIGADPLDETAHRALMAACRAAGEPARALIAYERLRVTLARELGIEPDPTTRDLYVSILRHNASTSRVRDVGVCG